MLSRSSIRRQLNSTSIACLMSICTEVDQKDKRGATKSWEVWRSRRSMWNLWKSTTSLPGGSRNATLRHSQSTRLNMRDKGKSVKNEKRQVQGNLKNTNASMRSGKSICKKRANTKQHPTQRSRLLWAQNQNSRMKRKPRVAVDRPRMFFCASQASFQINHN